MPAYWLPSLATALFISLPARSPNIAPRNRLPAAPLSFVALLVPNPMNSSFIASFPAESDFQRFREWLLCFEGDARIDANAAVNFVRVAGCFCKVTLAPSGRYDDVFNAVGGFNGTCMLD